METLLIRLYSNPIMAATRGRRTLIPHNYASLDREHPVHSGPRLKNQVLKVFTPPKMLAKMLT
jgi:hypothetical protein